MKNRLSFFTLLLVVLCSCASLNSVTIIEANQSFVLGEGKHGSYAAVIKNISPSPVEVFIQKSETSSLISLGVLEKGEQNKYTVPNNSKVIFKNNGDQSANIKIRLTGDTNLSMNYQANQ